MSPSSDIPADLCVVDSIIGLLLKTGAIGLEKLIHGN